MSNNQSIHNIINGMPIPANLVTEADGHDVDIERIKFILKHTPTPPVSDYMFQEITEEVIITKRNKERIGDCTICVTEFPLDTEAIKLPCKHYYHFDCITEWLKMHSSCPNCRTQLPTNNSEYDSMRRIVDEYEQRQKREDDDQDRSTKRSTSSTSSSMFS
ncbi:hypothetical protein SAMD00019534_065730, partial [Acytostelium subglobosum LB1]|uniref:hypothetical protein n=1 Tax=Acytostelium subglobosum LB1 TaxID=1410327 RepID=UPI0006448137